MTARRLAALLAMVVAIVVVPTTTASAHALLLQTEPSPQTTVPKAPDAVRLHFSEAVEVTFGAVRVFDVDGKRVDAGRISRAQGHRVVVVPVDHLKDGTYTVTWRVVSADGHPVHGGFVFYVGAPSSISPVAVAGDTGAGRVVGWGYGATRFVWFSALILLVGAVAVRLWVWTPATRAVGVYGSPPDLGYRRRTGRLLRVAWAVLVLSGAAALGFEAAAVSGLSLGESFKPSVQRQLLHTAFGHYWSAELIVTLLLLVPVLALSRPRPLLRLGPRPWIAVFGVLVAALCLLVGLNGHARTFWHPVIGVPSIAVHLVAVSVWVGGLAVLVGLGAPAWRSVVPEVRPAFLRQLVTRFSRIAIVAVLAVIATGVVNSIASFATFSDLWRVTYGRVVLAKVILLLLALVLAARHYRVTPARLTRPTEADAEVRSFRWTATAEVALLAGAVALAAGLVVLVPGRSLALAAKGPVNIERHIGPYTAQVFLDPSAVGSNQLHLTFVDAQGLAASQVANATVRLGPVNGTLRPVAMRLISPGHFVGDVRLPAPGRYRVSVDAAGAQTTFTFQLQQRSNR